MNVNNIVVEELGRKYKDKNYRLLYQIQVDYKKPPISKMLYLDKEALAALHSKVREFVDESDITKLNVVSFGHKCGKDCEPDLDVLHEHKFGSIIDIREANSFAEIEVFDKKKQKFKGKPVINKKKTNAKKTKKKVKRK